MKPRSDDLAARPAHIFRFSLYVLAGMVLVLALMVWNLRHQRKLQAASTPARLDSRSAPT